MIKNFSLVRRKLFARNESKRSNTEAQYNSIEWKF